TPREEKYVWTHHARMKLRFYRLTEARIKRIIRHPARVEEGILPRAVAAMSPADGKRYSEIWVMYVLASARGNVKLQNPNDKQLKVISAWRYPGRSPARNPIPEHILREIKNIL
ncbi:MAG: hypothetical protein AAB579_02000, partial [Patescibacteria group bacterium]